VQSTETWKPVVGYEGLYEVSDHGRVRSLNSRRARAGHPFVLRPTPIPSGYLTVKLYRSGAPRQTRSVHALVAEAFLGPSEGRVVRHLDGSRTGNRPSNLAWGTLSENSRDMTTHGTHRNIRKTHCPAGHEYTPENTYITRRGEGRTSRKCRACELARQSRLNRQKKNTSKGGA
jgi:hypothetical protein